jgi:hypothetical protein
MRQIIKLNGKMMQQVHVKRVLPFLVLTFALSWGFHLLIAGTIGHGAYLELGVSPLDMLCPAFVALILRLFVFKDSPVHFRRYRGNPRWILYGFLLLTVVYGTVTLIGVLVQGRSVVFQGVGNLLTTLWTLLVARFDMGQGQALMKERRYDIDWLRVIATLSDLLLCRPSSTSKCLPIQQTLR